MNIQEILALENRNTHKIYLYIDLENNLFIAYEFSAYLLTRLFDTLKLEVQEEYLQPIITQYFIDNKSEIWLLFLIAHSKR
ncbi:hypothetical protein NXY11_04325 [Parabacteroides faecis]|uniref:hypothetical protein n=1 Tax=Parabacteroides faecis TaxID=1217282 RepID=UPI0021643353|nr:hypothetical protein [Parabacteroides faecis]UVQ47479.1 hypothetical protein NXY11_04325 [Parabacteroides faecis]